ncbi:MAG: cyclase family protein [Streptosporangiaceae bacterium]
MTDEETASRAPAGGDRVRIDLSHVVEDGMATYPGFPTPVIGEFLSREQSQAQYAPGTRFQIGTIDLCGNTGTYLDSPFHRYAGGTDLADLPLERLAELDGLVVDVSGQAQRDVDRDQFLRYEVRSKAVLVRTGWDRHWRTDAYFDGHPFLTAAAAQHLAAAGAALVGIDSLNIDDTSSGERPAHSALLGAGIPICEHLTNLSALPINGFRFSAVPVKVRGMGTFPVRAYATLQRGEPG